MFRTTAEFSGEEESRKMIRSQNHMEGVSIVTTVTRGR